jgi:hypothetical protein
LGKALEFAPGCRVQYAVGGQDQLVHSPLGLRDISVFGSLNDV